MELKGFCGPAYSSISRAINAQRCVNLRLEIDQANGKAAVSLVRLPGYRTVKQDFPVAEVRGWWQARGRVFVVVGPTLYELAADMTATDRGTLPTSNGMVSIADNGLQLLAVDGTGVLALTLVDNTATNTIANFPYGASFIALVDNTFIANEPNSQRFRLSAVGNGLLWSALDEASVEGLPDDLVAIIAFNRQLYMLGTGSGQVFWNSGSDADRPFIPVEGSFAQIGCGAPRSACNDETGVYFLGSDPRGGPRVYKAAAGQWAAISTPALDAEMSGSNGQEPYFLPDAEGYTFLVDGHTFYVLTFPTSNRTWVYDTMTEAWQEMLEWDSAWSRTRLRCMTYAFGKLLAGDIANGKIYEVSAAIYANDGSTQRWLRAAPHLNKEQDMITVSSFEVVCEQGVGVTTGQGSEPEMMLRVSKDGGNQWTQPRMRRMGGKGKYRKRTRWPAPCGSARDLVFEVSGSDPVKIAVTGAIVNAF